MLTKNCNKDFGNNVNNSNHKTQKGFQFIIFERMKTNISQLLIDGAVKTTANRSDEVAECEVDIDDTVWKGC